MARFVMANRRAGMFTDDVKLRSRHALGSAFEGYVSASVDLVGDHSGSRETSRRILVFDGDPEEIEAKRPSMPPEVMLEPEILHYPEIALPLDLARMRAVDRDAHVPAGGGATLTLRVRGGGEALRGASVDLYLRGMFGYSTRLAGATDASGAVTFSFSSYWQPSAAVVQPVGGFWRQVIRGPRDGDTAVLRPLPRTGYTAWWHRLHGVNQYRDGLGRGVRVGVADTGLGPHPNVEHAQVQGAFVDGSHEPRGGADVDSHGTHVAGIVGARPRAAGELAGIAPGAELYCARVFPPDRGANQGDIANAIDHLSSESACDLINLSLGSPQRSEIERDAIVDALERGTLMLCAAANEGVSPVHYPARFAETLAISAIGRVGWGPDGSVSALNYPEEPEKYGLDGYFLAGFSNFGEDVSGAGGGVGILSTVPARHGYAAPYAAMDGTSMASPAACGALAAILSRDAEYAAMPRDVTRAQYARMRFRARARDLGLRDVYQGRGAPAVA